MRTERKDRHYADNGHFSQFCESALEEYISSKSCPSGSRLVSANEPCTIFKKFSRELFTLFGTIVVSVRTVSVTVTIYF
jgi:hypothetical protein